MKQKLKYVLWCWVSKWSHTWFILLYEKRQLMDWLLNTTGGPGGLKDCLHKSSRPPPTFCANIPDSTPPLGQHWANRCASVGPTLACGVVPMLARPAYPTLGQRHFFANVGPTLGQHNLVAMFAQRWPNSDLLIHFAVSLITKKIQLLFKLF